MKRWTKFLSGILMAFAMVSTVAFGNMPILAEDSEKSDETFTVGFDKEFPPFGYVDENGEYAGFDLDLAREAALHMGKEIVLQPIDWDAKDMELESGTIDCIWNGFTINGREDQYTWTRPYMTNSQNFVVRKDSGIDSMDDLKGKIVDVQKESSALSALEDNPKLMKSFKELIQVADYNTAIMDLESGAVDAVAMDYYVALFEIKDKEDLMVLEKPLSEEEYAIGFLKGNTELRDEVQNVLDAMIADGTYTKIYKQYFNEDPVLPSIDKETFTVGFDQDFPPFGYVDEKGDYVGFDIELAEECADRMGKEIVLQPIDWDAKDMELSSGTIDCIWSGFTVNGREDQYTWTKPYMTNYQCFVVREDDGIEDMSDLKGKIVDVQKESSALKALEDNPDLMNSFEKLIQVADYNTAIMDLESGAIDAVAMDYYVALWQIKDKSDLIVLDDYLSEETYAVGFLKGNEQLRDQVQEVFDEMIEDGTFEDIYNDYFSIDVVEDTQETGKMGISTIVSQLGEGMMTTIWIFFMTLLFALPLGLLIAFGRMSKNKIIQTFFKIYISIMRGTPLMLQMLVIYFGPYYLFGMTISSAYRGIAVIIAFSLNYAAYFAEIYRGGIESMPKGQYEASEVLGYSKVQTFFIIILPQVIKRILPSLTNEVITLVKDTSLAFSIAYAEMFTQAKALAAAQKSMIPFMVAAVFYYVFNFIVAFIMESIENKLKYYD